MLGCCPGKEIFPIISLSSQSAVRSYNLVKSLNTCSTLLMSCQRFDFLRIREPCDSLLFHCGSLLPPSRSVCQLPPLIIFSSYWAFSAKFSRGRDLKHNKTMASFMKSRDLEGKRGKCPERRKCCHMSSNPLRHQRTQLRENLTCSLLEGGAPVRACYSP